MDYDTFSWSSFLRAAEVCSVEILGSFPEEIMFDACSPCNVLRMMVVVTRKDKKKYTYQLSRGDRYPKLYVIHTLLIYFHTFRYEYASRYMFVQPSCVEKPFSYDIC